MRKMKDSGIEWIGEIPEDWNLLTIKRCISTRDSGAWGKEPNNSKNDIICIRVADFDYSHLSIKRKSHLTIRNLDTKTIEKLSLETGNILIEKSGGGEKTPVGRAVIFEEPYHAIFSNFIERLKINTNLSEKFFLYLWTVIYLTNYTNIYIRQTTGIQNLDITALLSNTQFPLPDLTNQVRIANFLDEKCALIDRLIERHQEVIEKLKAYRQSVISETVTRGLDPDAPMKDSGIAICGTIPVEWNISRIKYLFKLREEKNHQPLDRVKLLSLYTDIGVFPHGEQEERGNKAVTADGYKIVHKNDIVVNIILAWMGAIGISSYDGVTSPAYDIYMPIQNINPNYFHYLFRTKAFSGECYKYGRGIMAMRWRTYSTEFKSIKVPLPPIEVQNDIVSFLNKKVEDIENIIQKKLTVIAKLAEYKKSIIYEYVTGKKEVPAS